MGNSQNESGYLAYALPALVLIFGSLVAAGTLSFSSYRPWTKAGILIAVTLVFSVGWAMLLRRRLRAPRNSND